jgi:PIN domain nuclease of toxin-antitoxin system
MNYLIDTHILLWSLFEIKKINDKIKEILLNRNNSILVSKISLWEISLKFSLGKLEINGIDIEDLQKQIEKLHFDIIDLNNVDILTYYKLPKNNKHKDPFDRMLIWQSICNKYVLISRNSRVEDYKKNGLKYLY